jgi:hypothetical protein
MYFAFDIKSIFENYYGKGLSFLQPRIIRYGKIGTLIYELSISYDDVFKVQVIKDAPRAPKVDYYLSKGFLNKKDAESYLNSLIREYGRNICYQRGFNTPEKMVSFLQAIKSTIFKEGTAYD